MEHKIFLYRGLHFLCIAFKSGRFNSAHRRCCSTESRILCYRIIIIQFPATDTSFYLSCKIIIEVTLVGRLFHSPLLHGIKIKPPPDIIVTTKVIQKCILLWQTTNDIHLFLQKPDVSCRNTIPGRRHCCHIIEHMTFRFFNCTKIWYDLFRLHNHFAKKYHARTDNFCNHTHHSDNRMYFFQIPAACS